MKTGFLYPVKKLFFIGAEVKLKPCLKEIKSPGSCFIARLKWMILSLLAFSILPTQNLQAQNPLTFKAGSFIINMGAVTQTVNNGLKPYGLIYALIKSEKVPVYWIINPTKVKDGIDFIYNGVTYRGGTFIVPQEYITAAAQTRIAVWQGKGVLGAYTSSSLTLTPSYRLTSVPNWTLDAQNGHIAEKFLENAEIPVSAYNWLTPAELGICNDLFVMPHADPRWSTHGNLYNWNLAAKGAIWLGCHAGSALSDMYNPANVAQQTNFLSEKINKAEVNPKPGIDDYAENSLVLWTNHNNGSSPFNTVTGAVTSGDSGYRIKIQLLNTWV